MYQILLESLADGVFVAQDYRFVFANPALPAMLGYTVEEFVGLPFEAVVAPEHLELWTGRYTLRVGDGPEPLWEYEVYFLRRNGTRFWVELRARRIRFQGRAAVLGIIRDISQRKELQERERRARENAERVAALLAESHALLDTIFATAPVGLGLWDPELRFVRLNAKLAEVSGLPATAHMGKTLSEIWSGIADIGHLVDGWRSVLETGELGARQEIGEARDPASGPTRYWTATAFPVRNGADIIGVGAVVEEITERRAAETQLRLLAAVVENSGEFIGICTPEQEPLYVNEAGRRMVGLDGPEEVSKTRVMDYFWPEDRPYIDKEAIPALIREGRWKGEVRFRHFRTGEPIHTIWDVFVIRDADGKPMAWATNSPDLTVLKQAEQALRRSEGLYRGIGESIDYGVWVCDPEGRNVYVSESFLDLVGLTQEQFSDFGWRTAIDPADADTLAAAWKECVRTGEVWDREFRVKGMDGRYHPVLGRGLPIRDEQGKVVYWAGINLDIGRLKQAEEALREADRRKNEFLAMLGHELRNPLVPIRNAVEIMRTIGPLDPKLQWGRDVVQRQVEHLSRLVDDLLDVSRIVQGKLRLHKAPLDLAGVLDAAAETVRPLIEERRHGLEIVLSGETLRIDGDAVRLAQVVSNLLNNAAKYTPPGGRIRLALARDDESAVISVQDNGVGIAKTLLARIFEVFTQSARTLDRSEGGLGLGLTIVRNITELHGGRVEALSEGPGRGSEFVVRLPLYREAMDEAR